MRGFRPIAEIQYLDYLLYAIQILSDDLATLQYRNCRGSKSPINYKNPWTQTRRNLALWIAYGRDYKPTKRHSHTCAKKYD